MSKVRSSAMLIFDILRIIEYFQSEIETLITNTIMRKMTEECVNKIKRFTCVNISVSVDELHNLLETPETTL